MTRFTSASHAASGTIGKIGSVIAMSAGLVANMFTSQVYQRALGW